MADADRLIVARDEQPNFENSVVILLIGKEKSRYSIHGKILLERSEGYFDESILSVSGDERSIALPNINRSVCELYLHHLQVGNFPLRQDKPTLQERRQHKEAIAVTLIELYGMSTILSDRQTMHAAIGAILEIYDRPDIDTPAVLPAATSIAKAYAVTEPGSQLRYLMMDLYLHKARGVSVDSRLPSQFVTDLAGAALDVVRSLSKRPDPTYPILVPWLYHERTILRPRPSCTPKRPKHAEVDDRAAHETDSEDSDSLGSPPNKRARIESKAGKAQVSVARPAPAATMKGPYSRESSPAQQYVTTADASPSSPSVGSTSDVECEGHARSARKATRAE